MELIVDYPRMTMETELLLLPVAAGALAFATLKLRKQRQYRQLQTDQRELVERYGAQLNLPGRLPDALPDFQSRLATVADVLPDAAFTQLRDAALRHRQIERSYFPVHKQGGTIAYEDLHQVAPEIVAFYQSDDLRRICSAIIGEPVLPTPLHDQSSCSLLFYDRPRDHIGWHYDYNFYNGRHFTVLLPLVNRHLGADRLSSAQLEIRHGDREVMIPTPPNTLIVFEGARVFHRVTRLGENELRVMLSMTFCTRPQSSLFKGTVRRFKDIAYFGVRALWT
ncbi:MAG TPA: hypothetical protein PKI41_13805 [Candidatus Competibacteraceae bacterium]|nr:hypothetical protein [Candidatus Competibacteraceae bacterium]HQA24963.1 hypothetical protein [Candidatus Competibacteraceae bacterium]HQD57474.1 hypothetical protein [Candidatus Competibacteraceae bacterium]